MVESTTPGSGRNGEPVLPTRRSRREAQRDNSSVSTPVAPLVDAQSFPRLAPFGIAPRERATEVAASPAVQGRRAARLGSASAAAAEVSVVAAEAIAETPAPVLDAADLPTPAEQVAPAEQAAPAEPAAQAEPVAPAEPVAAPSVASFTTLPAAPIADPAPTVESTGTPRSRRPGRPSAAGTAPRSAQAPAPRVRRSLSRTLFAALIVPALFGTAALPAFASGDQAQAMTDGATYYSASELIRGDAQSVTVSAQVDADLVSRDGYSASNSGTSTIAGTALEGYSAPSDLGWWRPTDGPITSPYGPRGLICNGAGCSNSFHEGIDFGNACGSPIKAVADGRVTFVGNAGGYGNRVIIDHGEGVSTVYGHIQSGSYEVAVGDQVSGGVVIAAVGATGVVSGCHLDLKVEVDGEMTDPATYLTMMGVPKVIFGS